MFRLIRYIDTTRPETGFRTVWSGTKASGLEKVLGQSTINLHLGSFRLQISNPHGWVNLSDFEGDLSQESQQTYDALSETLEDFVIFVY